MPRNRNNDQRPLINGFINLYKPAGITSMDALRRVKRITGQHQKVGHGGTMDPLARGVLPVCFGQATRLMEYVVGGTKRYMMDIALGVATSTYDAEGEIIKTGDGSGVTRQDVESNLPTFIGNIQQTPPMYSAVKVNGQRLYKLARAGLEIEREARPVEIHSIRIVDMKPPKLTLDVDCGRGVYMRSLAHDLGEVLGCGAHVSDLVRLRCSGFLAEEGVTLEQLEQDSEAQDKWQQHLMPVDWVLRDLKSITMGQHAEDFIKHGQSISLGRPEVNSDYLEQYRAYNSEGHFLALVRYERSSNIWRPIKVFQIGSRSPFAPVAA